MIGRAAYDLVKAGFRLALQLWPLWLLVLALHLASDLWRDAVLATHTDHTTATYLLLYRAWPSIGLAGPIGLMLLALVAERARFGSRAMAAAGIAGVALATLLTFWPEIERLSPYLGRARPLDILRAVDLGMLAALITGGLAITAGLHALRGGRFGPWMQAGVTRAASDNHGHADWLAMADARTLFPGPDPVYGGIVVGEAYRVDRDRTMRGPGGIALPFDPADRRTWGRGGSAPLLVDPCRSGPTHALVLAGSGGFKTTSVGVPTLLTWTGSAVVLDPSREIGPMVSAYRRDDLGHTVVTLDPSDPGSGCFDALDWIDTGAPEAESNVEAVAVWLAGEPARGGREGGAEFFRDMGKALITCVLADLLWNPDTAAERTLRRLRRILVTPEAEMRQHLEAVHAGSASALARDLAGTLMGLVPETFSGIYANAAKATRWLSTAAYADLVSGGVRSAQDGAEQSGSPSFRTRDLVAGRLTVFVQIPLKVLQSTPGLGRVVVGALLNAVYEADGRVKGRVLFLLDEVARLGPMAAIETARDAGRKYGLTLLLLYQSLGQLVEQWGRDGARAWYDSTSWRLYAAVQDPETARELSGLCGEHGVVATAQGDSAGTQGRIGQLGSSNAGRSENRSETGRALIRPDELLQDTRADEAFVIVRGARPIRCGRAIFFRRPEMAARVAASRFQPIAAGREDDSEAAA